MSIVFIVILIIVEINFEELRKYSIIYLLFIRGKKGINIVINCINSNKYFGCCLESILIKGIFRIVGFII